MSEASPERGWSGSASVLPPGAVGRGAILVTGASSGIGEASALRMDQRGYRVFAGVRREEDANRLRAEASDRLTPIYLDVTEQRAIDDVAALIEEACGERGLAGLVNNAGVAITGPVEYLDVERYREQFEINYFGQIAVTQALMPAIRRGGGRIVIMGSIAGRVSGPFLSPYAGTKHALEALADSLRVELGAWGIEVSLVEPGAFKTRIWQKGVDTADEVVAELPEEASVRYGPFIEPMREFALEQAEGGADAAKVAEAVEHALTAKRPRTRYLVGRDARMQSIVRRFLPDRLFDRAVRRMLKLPSSLPRR